MTRRILITGIGGFAGGYLSPEMAAHGYEVTGLVGTEGHASVPGMQAALVVDLRDAAAVEEVVAKVQPTHVAHLAAISFVGHGDTREIYETNIVGTRNLLSALAKLDKKPEAVLLTSSANVYGNSDKGFLTETDEIQPANDYAVSKIAMEYMSRQFANALNIVIARPFNYTGRGQSANFLVPKIVNHFRARESIIELGNTDVARDFSDVRMVTQAFRSLLENPAAIGQVYNICSGRPYSLQDILSMCEALSGHRLDVRINPAFVRENEIKMLAGNPEKLHRDIGRFDDYPLEATLKWMLEA
jgi:nucleoside-diphosphate-sugar epimerase